MRNLRANLVLIAGLLLLVIFTGAGKCEGDEGGSSSTRLATTFGDGRHHPGRQIARTRYHTGILPRSAICEITIWDKREQLKHFVVTGRDRTAVAVDLRSTKIVYVLTEGCGKFAT
jgi:hypothetical protein